MPRPKLSFLVAACSCMVCLEAAGMDLAVSLGPWSFAGGTEGYAGTYGYTGLVAGLTPRLECELYGVGELTPDPASVLLAGVNIGISLSGDRGPTYFNMVMDVGLLAEWRADSSGPVSVHALLRVSPLVIGNPYYGYRDRIFSIGLLYDLTGKVSRVVWNVLMAQWFFQPG